jgi:hypothetical protein
MKALANQCSGRGAQWLFVNFESAGLPNNPPRRYLIGIKGRVGDNPTGPQNLS